MADRFSKQELWICVIIFIYLATNLFFKLFVSLKTIILFIIFSLFWFLYIWFLDYGDGNLGIFKLVKVIHLCIVFVCSKLNDEVLK